MYKFRDVDKYYKNEYFVHNSFDESVKNTEDFVKDGRILGYVNRFMFKKISEKEYIIFSVKDFSVFKVTFEPQKMKLLMKDGTSLSLSIVATANVFELDVPEGKNLVPYIPEKDMFESFLSVIKSLCSIERRMYVPSISEARKIHTIRSKAKIKICSKESNTYIAWTNKDEVTLRMAEEAVYVTINGVEHFIAPGIYVNAENKAKWALETYNRIEDTMDDAYYNDSVELSIDGLIDTSYNI
jgi:hypothetical protein